MRGPWFTAAVLSLCVDWAMGALAMGVARGETIPVEFFLEPAVGEVNRVELSVKVRDGFFSSSDSKTADLSGNALTKLDIDFEPDEKANVTGIEFTGGEIAFSNLMFRLFFGAATARTRGLRGTLDTPLPPGVVVGGEFETAQHNLTINQGTAVASGFGFNETINFAAAPLPASGAGKAFVTISHPMIIGDEASYKLELRMPVNFDEDVPNDALDELNIKGKGEILARGLLTRELPRGLLSDLVPNGFVDADDLFVLLSHWNEEDASAAVGNIFDPAGTTIDKDDLFVLLAGWTGPPPGPADPLAAAAVPEPSSLALLALALVSLAGWPRRRRADRMGGWKGNIAV